METYLNIKKQFFPTLLKGFGSTVELILLLINLIICSVIIAQQAEIIEKYKILDNYEPDDHHGVFLCKPFITKKSKFEGHDFSTGLQIPWIIENYKVFSLIMLLIASVGRYNYFVNESNTQPPSVRGMNLILRNAMHYTSLFYYPILSIIEMPYATFTYGDCIDSTEPMFTIVSIAATVGVMVWGLMFVIVLIFNMCLDSDSLWNSCKLCIIAGFIFFGISAACFAWVFFYNIKHLDGYAQMIIFIELCSSMNNKLFRKCCNNPETSIIPSESYQS